MQVKTRLIFSAVMLALAGSAGAADNLVEMGMADVNASVAGQSASSMEYALSDYSLASGGTAYGGSVQTNLGLSVANLQDTHYSAFVGHEFDAGSFAIVPELVAGYDSVGFAGTNAYSANRAGFNISVSTNLDAWLLSASAGYGRTFESAYPTGGGDYSSASIGIRHQVGNGALGLRYGYEQLPLFSNVNIVENSLLLGYTLRF